MAGKAQDYLAQGQSELADTANTAQSHAEDAAKKVQSSAERDVDLIWMIGSLWLNGHANRDESNISPSRETRTQELAFDPRVFVFTPQSLLPLPSPSQPGPCLSTWPASPVSPADHTAKTLRISSTGL
ncbi:uncharacterized protein PGTG_03956 [Puccinia graminis f. sp. tritici CRL 75-36-700-3]|uniref:Uncharacterized protein n=1 Tax=Puccinia graminis f. sp. tritici (strain CRL 75-36-700-3 / race SCCL) TaxID=418459 RepID=E3K125_PUCGT|nr:uncharacterized protein PGTG_03956 [Puccinia graminis f. sp. tritici CRL 75-36-700-3]EFP78000.1 hypothetical protein PGTG_03956 [Puccinia graminis f. sp. tritici CRL 75-36-700-3]